jgi:N-acetylmuramic acid 6-phosphate etherase
MQLRELTTERRNPATEQLDAMSTFELVTVMNREDAVAPRLNAHYLRLLRQSTLLPITWPWVGGCFYVGAGTSGRIGALDASECAPTFGTPTEMVQFLIAGGAKEPS